jgi:peptidoglycan/xylan/chitin deacetylase (PgdA/CDA1 family)
MHLISLSFDDGFLKSNLRIAQCYERHGLSACFNVLAAPHDVNREEEEKWGAPRGDFAAWNELQRRGHEIMPHGYRHDNKTQMPFAAAKEQITRCLAIFAEQLDSFDASRAVFNFPYNQSTPELEAWLPSVVRAFRTRGKMINPLPHPGQVKLGTGGHGPENCEAHLDSVIAKLLALPSGWLIYNTHGLDEEGWGPIRATYLDALLDRLVQIESVRVMPTARALNELAD